MNLLSRTRAVLARARDLYRDPEPADQLAALAARLNEPLRVAIAGRVKAGKSTLLNALVADRLAATDASECTRVVTWYRDGHTYQVLAHSRDGRAPRQLPFHRDQGVIEVDLAGLRPEELERLTVTWPSQALRDAVLIDTPGIGSLSDQVSARTWQLLAPEAEETPADAVVYLLRHLHRHDLDFLHAFHDTEVARPNPLNAIGVLSRADEIGVGRLDAMTSARRIAARMSADPDVRRVVQTVVPVAGLLAETAATLTEAEVAQLRTVARLPVRETESLLLSADRFVRLMPELGLTATERGALLGRFGLFGVRLATVLLRRQVVSTATELATELTDRSGIGGLRQVLDTLFFERRDVLKSRSILFALDALLRTRPVPGSEAIAAGVEEIVASAHTFNELRILSAVRAGWVEGDPDLLTALEDIVGGGGTAAHRRLRLPAQTGRAALAAAASAALATWQRRAENPLTSHELAAAARVAVRSCEGMIAELGTHDHDHHDRS